MKDNISAEIQLSKYIRDSLRGLNLGPSNSKNEVKANISKLLKNREITVVSNSNGHNYTIGEIFVLSAESLYERMNIDVTAIEGTLHIHRVSFVQLKAGGNHILADDMSIASEICTAQYLEGLKLLRNIIDFEIDFIGELHHKEKEKILSKTLLDIVNSPMSIPNHLGLKNIINTYKLETEKYREKRERYHDLANTGILTKG